MTALANAACTLLVVLVGVKEELLLTSANREGIDEHALNYPLLLLPAPQRKNKDVMTAFAAHKTTDFQPPEEGAADGTRKGGGTSPDQSEIIRSRIRALC